MKYTIAFLFFISVLYSSCTQDTTCRENKDVKLHADFINQSNNSKLTVDSVTVFGVGQDSLIYNNKKSVDKILIPLNNAAEDCSFVIIFDEIADTINVKYTNIEYFMSYSCGVIMAHEIDTVTFTDNYIKEIIIQNRIINPTDVKHIQILH
ncbi:MAG: hypothetical protein BGO29_03320 [Bacteroidales bacterium 36-12]|nr:MAG: hypothetical protein BGO29_03320 [Bacteroidales bacterium 36-12]